MSVQNTLANPISLSSTQPLRCSKDFPVTPQTTEGLALWLLCNNGESMHCRRNDKTFCLICFVMKAQEDNLISF